MEESRQSKCRSEAGGRMLFANRIEAGQHLAARLSYLKGRILSSSAYPGGCQSHSKWHAGCRALDVILVRKLGVPFQPELAMGAIGEGAFGPQPRRDPDGRVSSQTGCRGPTGADRTGTAARRFRGDRQPIPLKGKRSSSSMTASLPVDSKSRLSGCPRTRRGSCRPGRSSGTTRLDQPARRCRRHLRLR